MPSARRSFAVIGLGRFGGTVAGELARFGNDVLGVDADERLVARYAPQLTETAILDATDEHALRELGVQRYDVGLVAIGDDLEASILATLNLKLAGVGTVWAKAGHRSHHRILSRLGADRVILPEHEMGRHVAQALNNPAVMDYFGLGNGYSVVSIRVPAARAGQRAGMLVPATLRIAAAMRGTETLDLAADDVLLAEDDVLVVIGRRADLQAFGDQL